MRYRKLSPDNDYTFGGGQLNFYRDEPAAVGQAALTRLLLWLGEWYLNTDDGTPYMLGVLGKHSQTSADATIQNQVLGTQGLVDITNYNSVIEPNSRGYSATMDIDTIYGPTAVDVQNYVNF